MKKILLLSNLLIIWALFPAFAQKKVFITDNFTANGITELEVEGRFCNVRIAAQDSPQVDFHSEIKGKKLRYTYQIKHLQEGSKLKVWIEVDKSKPQTYNRDGDDDVPEWKNFSINSNYMTANLWFKVPKNLKITVNNTSGRVFLNGLASEKMEVKTNLGTVHLDNLIGNPMINISSGRLIVNNLQGNAIANSTSGNQIWANVKGNIESKVSSGRIRIQQVEGDVLAVATSGTINLDKIQGKVNAETTSGRIKGNGLKIQKDSHFQASSGSIKVGLKNDLKEFRFDLQAGSGNIRVGKSRRMTVYKQDKGTIQLLGITHSGRQRYY
jgi:DUF4097 and DUF4098 domain-containing protein YvlB